MIDYTKVVRQQRFLDVREAVDLRNPRLLAALLRRAKDEHTRYEEQEGFDVDWADWYAHYLLGALPGPSDNEVTAPAEVVA